MSFTFTTSASAIKMAGANANATIVADTTQLGLWSDMIEAILCDIAVYDLVTNYASLTANGKKILAYIEDAWIAQLIIGYDPLAFGSLRGAETKLDILENAVSRYIKLIEDGKIRAYLSAE